jgi:hypothetical protein
MRNQRIRAAKMVADQLARAEADIEQAILSQTQMMTTLFQARAAAGLSHVIGRDSFNQASDAAGLLMQARSRIVDMHHSLHQVQADIGLGNEAFGTTQGVHAELAVDTEPSNVIAIGA